MFPENPGVEAGHRDVDVVRELAREGRIGDIHEDLYVTMGNVAPIARARQFGREIAEHLRKEGIEAVLLSAT
jgi:glycine reductase